MKLSILICSLPQREDDLKRLINSLEPQLPGLKKHYTNNIKTLTVKIWDFVDVEIIAGIDNKQLTVGAKRNKLMELATGDYIAFVDDDDRVSDDYVRQLLRGIKGGADVINFQVMYNPVNGKSKPVVYSLNFMDSEAPHCYYRASNHLMCIKREKALQVKFKNISFAEDSDFARRLKGVCRSQTNIDKILYYYDFDHAKSETQ